jgi:2-dehydropantoate 2-reductase
MSILIVGIGGVGSFIASKLTKVMETSFICRSNYEAISKGPIIVISNKQEIVFQPFKVYASLEEAKDGIFDHVLICTKAFPTRENAEMLKPVISKNSMIHLIQNGIGIEDNIQNIYPNNPIVSTVAYIGAWQSMPGKFIQQGPCRFISGLYKHTEEAFAKLFNFAKTAQSAGLTYIGPVDNIQLIRWHKLLWNCAFNTISVVSGKHVCGELLSNKHTEALIKDIMTEIKDAAEVVLGEQFPSDLKSIEELIEMTRNDLPNYRPSMLLDWENNRPLEIDAIVKNTLEIAMKHGITMPKLETIFQLLNFMHDNRK